MIYLSKDVKSKIDSIDYSNLYIVTDFDRTVTVGSSSTSWSILSKSNLVPKEYVKERQELFDYYRPIEIDLNIDVETKNSLMAEWFRKHLDLFIKYRLSEEVIKKAAMDLNVMNFRGYAKDFLEKMHREGIPVIIISAGVGNFVEQFLIKNNCYFDNIYIVANFIIFENGVASGVAENIIHALNKNEVSLPKNIMDKLINRDRIILLGDSIADTKMVSDDKRENTIRVGFLEENVKDSFESFKSNFDIVCTDNTAFDELMHVLKIEERKKCMK